MYFKYESFLIARENAKYLLLVKLKQKKQEVLWNVLVSYD